MTDPYGASAQYPENTVPDAGPLRPDIEATIKEMVATQLAAERDKHEAEIAAMRADLERAQQQAVIAASAPPINLIPEHAAGPGTEIAPTWSLAEQEAVRG